MTAVTRRILIGGFVVALLTYAGMAIASSFRATRRLHQEQSEFGELSQKLGEIRRWASAPRVAALDVESPDQILNRISMALEESGLDANTLSNQTPSEPQRLGQSDFQLRKVDITLRRATIAQIVRFCEALRDESTGSVVRDLQCYDPETQGGRETWLSQMTLTQVIFSPKSES
ncbi:MAG: hypothetical protein AAF802_03020 [Planctomycetota bacterium]